MRKRWIVAALLILTAGIAVWGSVGFFSQAAVVTGAGPLVVTPGELDLQSDTGETEQVEFRLSNSGSDRLRIREVRTTCGCTIASQLERYELEPGEETLLRVQIQPPSFGTKETAISIVTDSSKLPAVHIPVVLRGRILSPPFVGKWPLEIRHSSVEAAEIEIPFVVLCVEEKGEPWLTGFEGESSRISVTAPKVRETVVLDETTVYREYELTLKLAAAEAGGAALSDVLRPTTRSEPTRPLPMIPVTISRQPAVRAAPSTLLVRRQQLADGLYVRRVAIVSETDEEWKIAGIEASAPWVRAKLAADATTTGRFVEISVPEAPSQPDGPSEATVELETTHPLCPRISIAVVVD